MSRSKITSGKYPLEKTVNSEVFPQAPSPTITSFFLKVSIVEGVEEEEGQGSTREVQNVFKRKMFLLKKIFFSELFFYFKKSLPWKKLWWAWQKKKVLPCFLQRRILLD